MSNSAKPQVIIVKQRGNGCLVTALAFLLFGWLGLAALAVWKLLVLAWRATWALVRATWAVFVAYPVRWTVQGSRAAWPYAVRGARAFHAKYGMRGWLVAGGVLVVLVILDAVFVR